MRISANILTAIFVTAVVVATFHAETTGSFRGKIVESDATATEPNWIYVEGRNHSIRRVEISHASVEYDEDVPSVNRKAKPERALVAGTEVRVTAVQGKDGEWRASRVEILSVMNIKKAAASPHTSFP